MKQLVAFRKGIYRVYLAMGIFAMGLLAGCVIFAVVARYFFSLSWKQMEEFMTTLFAFTTFWGMGICVLENEHVMIDIFYNTVKPSVKRWLTLFNEAVMFLICALLVYYSGLYVQQAGSQISMGMEIQMKYMYGIMPVCFLICMVCLVFRMVECVKAPLSAFEPQNRELVEETLQ